MDSKLHKQASARITDEEIYGADPAVFNEDIHDVVCESPGARCVRELEESFPQKHLNQDIPKKFCVKVLERPKSSGNEEAARPQYQMTVASFRPAQVKRPAMTRPPTTASLAVGAIYSEAHTSFQPETSSPEQENTEVHMAFPDPPDYNPPDIAIQRSPSRPRTRGKRTEAMSRQDAKASDNQRASGEEPRNFVTHKWSSVSDMQNSVQEEKRGSETSNFAPASMARKPQSSRSDSGSIAVIQPTDPPHPSPQIQQALKAHILDEGTSVHPNAVLPSIENDNAGQENTLTEQTSQHLVPKTVTPPKSNPHAQMKPAMSIQQRQNTVLDGRITRRPPPKTGERKPSIRNQPRPMPAATSPPSEEDLFFLLMHRNRRARDRELELEASHKKLHAQVDQLHEQSRTYHQQLTAANARTEKQELEITVCKSEIENFKSRFIKFKTFATDLAKDYTDMGAAMKKIRGTTDELVRDKGGITHDLDSLHNALASANQVFVGLRPKIAATANEAVTVRHVLHVTEERLRISDSCLQHERVRNNRIETKILNAQQIQERFSLASMQEYGKAAAYLDDLCQMVLHLGNSVTKKLQPKDTPGVLQCLTLLQALAETQSTGITRLMEIKTLATTTSERLLSYHNTVEEAAKKANANNGQLSKAMLAQVATTVATLGPLIDAELEVATLHERIANLEKNISLGNQMMNLVYNGKKALKQCDKEHSDRLDRLTEQIAEANKRQQTTIDTSSPYNTGPDLNIILTKYMQANTNFNEVQAKLLRKDEELHQRSLDSCALNEKFINLQAEQESSQSALSKLRGEHHSLQGNADALLQETITLKEQIKSLEEASLRAVKVPKLVEDIAAKDAELNQLRPKATKVQTLVQELAEKERQLNLLQNEAARVPVLVQDVLDRDTELDQLRPNAAKVSQLTQDLAAMEKDHVHLREKASFMSELKELIASKEAELKQLRPKAVQFEIKARQNIAYQSDIYGYKNTIQTLEKQLAAQREEMELMKQTVADSKHLEQENTRLNTEAANAQQTILSLKNEVREHEHSAQLVDTLKKEITALKINWNNRTQLKKDLAAQEDTHAKQVAQLDELHRKIEEAQPASSEIPTSFQKPVQQLPQQRANLYQQLNEAAKDFSRCQALRGGNENDANEETISLRSRLQITEKDVSQQRAVREDHQQESGQVPALQQQIQKNQIHLIKTRTVQKPMTFSDDDEEYATQQTILELRDIMNREEQAVDPSDAAARRPSVHFSKNLPDLPQLKEAQRNASTAKNSMSDSLQSSHAHDAETSNIQPLLQAKRINDAHQIPNSQTRVDMNDILATSSPLSIIGSSEVLGRPADNALIRGKDASLNLVSPSSYGCDTMLLEDIEAVEGMITDQQPGSVGQYANMGPTQRQLQKQAGYGQASSRTIVTNGGIRSDHHRARSDLSTQIIQETQLQDQYLSVQDIMPSSPTVPMKNLPNSAIKRPRVEEIDHTPPTQRDSKRQRRAPADLEVKKASKRPMSSDTQITEPESTHVDRFSLPNGSRQGSVVGASAFGPRKAQSSRKSTRKSKKSNRYVERFNRK